MGAEQARGRLREAYGIEQAFILYVGNLEPRKNLSRLLEAFAQLRQKELIPHKLVIVGQKAWLYEGIFETIRKHSLGTRSCSHAISHRTIFPFSTTRRH